MGFLVAKDEVMYLKNADDVSVETRIPVGFYKLDRAQSKGIFLKNIEFKTSHGKIYGKSQSIADHVVTAYRKSDKTKNLGVLLSGGRGLGKTLTSCLIIEQLAKEYPVIIISDYIPGMADFLEHIQNCVILMDEFEKFMGGNVLGNDSEDEQSKQETMLSILDGNTPCTGNLFILTVNDTHKLDKNLKSRPGRIKYHFRYESESADVVRDYCKDRLEDKSKTEDVVLALAGAENVSLDIISSFVEELNMFPDKKPTDVLEYFNIESEKRDIRITVVLRDRKNGNVYRFERICRNGFMNCDGMKLCKKDLKTYQDLFIKNKEAYPTHILASLDPKVVPSYLYGKEEIDAAELSVDYIDFTNEEKVDWAEIEGDWEILSVYAEDINIKYTMKRYMGKGFEPKTDYVDFRR